MKNLKEKLIKRLLESKQFKKSLKITKEFSKDIMAEKYANEIIENFLKEVYPQVKARKNIYGNVVKVSASGMSRTANFYLVTDDKEIISLNYYLRLFLDINTDKQGYSLNLQGCGMDMLFNTVYNFSYILFNDGYTLKSSRL